MTILVDQDSRLSKALELHEDVLEYIVSLNPHDFNRLRNRLMRNLMPPRIALARIAKMTNTDVVELLEEIHRIAGSPLTAEDVNELHARQTGGNFHHGKAPLEEPPEWAMVDNPVLVDLLESDDRLDADPMLPINAALNTHPVGTVIVIKHRWEPQPLYDVWDNIGVEHAAIQIDANQWMIFVRKTLDRKERPRGKRHQKT